MSEFGFKESPYTWSVIAVFLAAITIVISVVDGNWWFGPAVLMVALASTAIIITALYWSAGKPLVTDASSMLVVAS